MTRDKFNSIMLSNGFTFSKTTLSYPGWRGDEDVYTMKPKFRYTFRVFRMYKDSQDYGLYVGIGNTYRYLNSIVEHDIDLEGNGDNPNVIPMWSYDASIKLINKINNTYSNYIS